MKMRHVLPLLALLLGPVGAPAAELSAVLDWGRRVELGTLVSGVVSEVPVQPGQRVDAGAVLLRLDPRGFRAQAARAEAAVERARVLLDEAEREDERAMELYDRTVLSDHERRLAAIALQEARAQLQEAEAQRVQAKLDLEHSVIRAPFAGVIVAVDAAVGQVIVSQLQSRPLVVLADDRRMMARTSVPAEQAEDVAQLSWVTVNVRGGTLEGGPPQVGLEPDGRGDDGVFYQLRVPLDLAPEVRLRAGEQAIIQIPD